MKLLQRFVSIGVLTIFAAAAGAESGAPTLNQRSDKTSGLVTVNSDLVLQDGRLIIRVVAFNKSAAPVALAAAQITLSTLEGKPVPLASIEQLEDETRVAFGAKPVHRPADYAATSAMQRPAVVTTSGQRDVSGYTGGETTSSTVTAAPGKRSDESSNAELNAALENLRAAILHPTSIAPQSAAGGNIVTQAIKFGHKEPRRLRLSIEFAGEHHEFEFEVPKETR